MPMVTGHAEIQGGSVGTDLYVDCSSNNGIPNVAAYADAGHRKLSVKVSEGAVYHWFGGEGVIDAAHRHGLVVQHYHWLRPDSDPRSQADYFARWVEKRFHPGDDLMTDFETTRDEWGNVVPDGSDAHRADQLAAFQERVTALVRTPCVYTGNWYLDEKGEHSQAECRRWPVVMSDYSGVTELPNPYRLNYIAWQYTMTARVAGFAGLVDYNRTLTAPPTTTGTDSAGSTLLTEGAPTMMAYRVGQTYYLLQDGARVHHVAPDYAHNISAMCGRPVAVVSDAMHKRIVANQAAAAKGK